MTFYKAWSGENDYELCGLSVQVDDLGAMKVTETWNCRDEAAAVQCLNFDESDCTVPIQRVLVSGSTAKRDVGDLWQVTRSYDGIIDEASVLDPNTRRYKLTTKTNTEPIETHPNFMNFAWPPGTNGSWFDPANGDFIEFRYYSDLRPNNKAGVRDFHCPVTTLTERRMIFLEDIEEEFNKLNKIDEPPGRPYCRVKPNYPKRNWLITAKDPIRVGFEVYELVTVWSLSGPRGWDKDIYTRV